nr:S8 family serine peptidase [Ornithinimicrobium sp. HY1745]
MTVAQAQEQPAPPVSSGAAASADDIRGADGQEPTVAAEVTAQLETGGSADVWVRFTERPDLSQFAGISDWDERGQAVYAALTDAAETSQREVREQLDADKIDYDAFWATNAIRIESADADLVDVLVAEDEVEGIYATTTYDPPVIEESPARQPAGLEWGVQDIKAPQVWDEFGATGDGIVVASIDTGVQFDHPALVNSYRGNNGDGTFTHDYNWFDAANSSPEEPADADGHGTHTMGTMIGDDGGENQIGVAPGARWISANGCCPSDQALISSGQWMLAPTRIDGSDPDPGMRPHIINNSWSSSQPSNDPFMEDVIEAWDAAGIFSMWANGNDGSACETSGSPGSRTITYSVGNYTSEHAISSTSGRGPGQDGEVKPNISAPGTQVRSAYPDNGYATASGTSMASPHAAGAVALLWSASPTLVGDIQSTRDLLDGTATDTEDLQCGGTAERNNVFGEGRLDALALVAAAPTGETGTITGVVTDAEDAEPLPGATVAIEGPVTREVTTNDEGAYEVLVTAGDYSLTASAFSYDPQHVDVTVEPGSANTADFALTSSPVAPLGGTVTDGSGQGWPLHARVTVVDTGIVTFTDPDTGEYAVDLPVGRDYSVLVEAQHPGYLSQTLEVTGHGAGADSQDSGDPAVGDVELAVDEAICTAPGYEFRSDGLMEGFDTDQVPEGWQVINHLEDGDPVWTFENPNAVDNMTGGEGNFALMYDPTPPFVWGSDGGDKAGMGPVFPPRTTPADGSLVSPPVDLSGIEDPVIGFAQDLRYYYVVQKMDVDYSLDGGETWHTVLSQEGNARGPRQEVVPVDEVAGEESVQFRFHFKHGGYAWWWQVDDVYIGNRYCHALEGSLVHGQVTDVDTGEGLVGATITSVENPQEAATAVEAGEDPALGDGRYALFVSGTGTHDIEVGAYHHESRTESIELSPHTAVRADVALGSGWIAVSSGPVQTYPQLGRSVTTDVTLTNTGSGAAEVSLAEVAGDMQMLNADGTRDLASDLHQAEGAPLRLLDVEVSPGQFTGNRMGAQAEQVPELGVSEDGWTSLPILRQTRVDSRAVSLDGTWYLIGGASDSGAVDEVVRYDEEAMAWEPAAPLPSARSAVAAGVVDGAIVATGGWVADTTTTQTLVYDPDEDVWTRVSDNPSAVAAAGQAVADGRLYSVGGCTTLSCDPITDAATAYDPATDTWEELAPYPLAVAHPSCAGIDGTVYCTGGTTDGNQATAATYAYDPGTNTWAPVADAPVASWGTAHAMANGMLVMNGGFQDGQVSNATYAYDPATDQWQSLPNTDSTLFRSAGACGIGKFGGTATGVIGSRLAEYLPGLDDCAEDATDVGWLIPQEGTVTVPAGDSVTVEVTTDGSVPQPGVFTAGLQLSSNTPQRFDVLPVTMTVTPPRSWSKVLGTVTGQSCDGVESPLPGATIAITPRGDHPGWVLSTDADGTYAQWVNTKETGRALEIIAAKDTYRPVLKSVKTPPGVARTADFQLRRIGC